jgi:hypothetical protein
MRGKIGEAIADDTCRRSDVKSRPRCVGITDCCPTPYAPVNSCAEYSDSNLGDLTASSAIPSLV